MSDFKRIPHPSRRIYRGADPFGELTPRGRWLLKHHMERAKRNPEYQELAGFIMRGEIGTVHGMTIISNDIRTGN